MQHPILIFCLVESILNTVEYFLLGNFLSLASKRYMIIVCFGLMESFYCHLPLVFQPIGLLMMIFGLLVRLTAISQLRDSFSHKIQSSSKCKKLYTKGLYSKVRHPAYLGFFLYAIGGQLMLRNVVSLCCLGIGLRRFFLKRIHYEEFVLSLAFPGEYLRYKSATVSGIA